MDAHRRRVPRRDRQPGRGPLGVDLRRGRVPARGASAGSRSRSGTWPRWRRSRRERAIELAVVVYPSPYQILANERESRQVSSGSASARARASTFVNLFPAFVDPPRAIRSRPTTATSSRTTCTGTRRPRLRGRPRRGRRCLDPPALARRRRGRRADDAGRRRVSGVRRARRARGSTSATSGSSPARRCGSWSSDALARGARTSFEPDAYFANADADRARWEDLLRRAARSRRARRARVLDVGCGRGDFLRFVARPRARVGALRASSSTAARARDARAADPRRADRRSARSPAALAELAGALRPDHALGRVRAPRRSGGALARARRAARAGRASLRPDDPRGQRGAAARARALRGVGGPLARPGAPHPRAAPPRVLQPRAGSSRLADARGAAHPRAVVRPARARRAWTGSRALAGGDRGAPRGRDRARRRPLREPAARARAPRSATRRAPRAASAARARSSRFFPSSRVERAVEEPARREEPAGRRAAPSAA